MRMTHYCVWDSTVGQFHCPLVGKILNTLANLPRIWESKIYWRVPSQGLKEKTALQMFSEVLLCVNYADCKNKTISHAPPKNIFKITSYRKFLVRETVKTKF